MPIVTIVTRLRLAGALARPFSQRDAAPAPVPPIRTQLVRPPSSRISRLFAHLQRRLPVPRRAARRAGSRRRCAGRRCRRWRIGADLAVALTAVAPSGARDIVGGDHATGLTAIEALHAALSGAADLGAALASYPRYPVAADGALDGSALWPPFVDAFYPPTRRCGLFPCGRSMSRSMPGPDAPVHRGWTACGLVVETVAARRSSRPTPSCARPSVAAGRLPKRRPPRRAGA